MDQIPEKAKLEAEKSNSKDQNRIGVRGIYLWKIYFVTE